MSAEDASAQLVIDTAFVEAHSPWMYQLAQRLLQDTALAEDAVQDAFVAAYRHSKRFEGRAAVRTWLHRITINAALAIQRKRTVRTVDIDDLQPLFDANECRIEAPWGQMPTVDEVMQRAELAALVRQSVAALPEAFRICLQLRDFEELSVKEVADALEISEENVKVRTHRARAALKRLLEPLLRGRPVTDIADTTPTDDTRPTMMRKIKGLMLANMPYMITCEQFESFIADYLEGDLPAGLRRKFDFHIRFCRECREYLAAYERTRALGRASADVDMSEVPEDLLAAVTTALQDAKET